VRDHAVWWPYETLLKKIEKIKRDFPDLVSAGFCGETCRKRKIPYLVVGKGKPILGLVGTVHAGESGPELIIPAIAGILKNKPELLEKAAIVAIPSLNIDSREQMVEGIPWYIRKNDVGVDLNRNFPAGWDQVSCNYGLDSSDPNSSTYRGAYPSSEPEVLAVMNFFSKYKPRVVFSFHFLAGICGLPGLVAQGADKSIAFKKQCQNLIGLYGKGLYPEQNYADNWLLFACSSGSLSRWFWEEFDIPCFDLEMGAIDKKGWEQCRWDRTDRTLLKDYQKRHQRAIENVLSGIVFGCGFNSQVGQVSEK